MEKYPSYKPSGISWLGDIPENWDSVRLKYYLESNDGGVWGIDLNGIDEPTFVFRSTEINVDGTWNLTEEPELRILTENEKNKALLKNGDLLLTKSSGSQLHIGKTALVNKEIEEKKCCYSNFMQRLRPLSIESSKFLHIFLNSQLSREQYNYLSNTTTGLANLSAGLLNDIIVPSPPENEQTTIANYLAEKTAQLDTLISNKQKLIELLKEERTAIINDAVNGKGKNWEKKKLKYVAKLKSGDGITSDDIRPEGDYPVYGGNGLRGYTDKYTHEGDYILIGRQGALCGNINYANGKFFASEHAVVVSILNDSEFIWLGKLLRSMNLNQYSQASAQPGLSVEKIQNLTIPVPSIKEQTAIVKHIQTETQRIDNPISKIEKEIELLREYRTALISEVVTGKVKII